MGFENWREAPDQNVAKREREKDKDEEGMSRRGFLKAAGVATVAAGGVMAFNKIDRILDLFDKDEEFEEIEEIEEKPRVEQRELSEAEKIAKEILDTFNLPAVGRRFDSKVFTKDFYMAQQFQESRGRKELESGSNAKGVYQNKADSVVEVVEYLDFLRDSTADGPAEARVDYLGPETISDKQAEEVSEYFKVVADYGRATGKLYLQAIHDPEYKYCDGKPNKDVFRGLPVKEQQERLLVAYHDGPAQRVNPKGASPNGRDYVKYVFEHMETIADLRSRFEKAGMSRDLDYAILKLMRELERKENRNNKEHPHARETAINFWIKKLQDAHMELWKKTGNPEDKISSDTIREMFPKAKK